MSYDDSHNDFINRGPIEYNFADPTAGNNPSSGAERNILGNIQIFYRITYDHGALLGAGNVDAVRISTAAIPTKANTSAQTETVRQAGNRFPRSRRSGRSGRGPMHLIGTRTVSAYTFTECIHYPVRSLRR